MDRRQIGAKLVLDALGHKLEIDEFLDRLILQKTMYLVQAAGVNLGYRFVWYLHGPYSRGLASDSYVIKAEIRSEQPDDDSRSWSLNETSLTQVHALKVDLLDKLPDDRKLRGRQLELLASVRFLLDSRLTMNNTNLYDRKTSLADLLKAYGKDYSREQVSEAFASLTNASLLS